MLKEVFKSLTRRDWIIIVIVLVSTTLLVWSVLLTEKYPNNVYPIFVALLGITGYFGLIFYLKFSNKWRKPH